MYWLFIASPGGGRDAYDLGTDDYDLAVERLPAAKDLAGFPAGYDPEWMAQLTHDPHPQTLAKYTQHTPDLAGVDASVYVEAEIVAAEATSAAFAATPPPQLPATPTI